jgi:C4-type Zn-finger protein
MGEEKTLISYDLEEGIFVIQAGCPNCGRFMKSKNSRVSVNGLGEIIGYKNLVCKKCGHIKKPNELGFI